MMMVFPLSYRAFRTSFFWPIFCSSPLQVLALSSIILEIVRVHSVCIASADHKDYGWDLLRVHGCNSDCAVNLLVLKHLKRQGLIFLMLLYLSLLQSIIGISMTISRLFARSRSNWMSLNNPV
ncbi:hypothetical protein BDR07DRAFT_699129 [Suillus spraguei]|nr:hypothetical protein BDR07DRAFT_699129 [Suillus spraguei]